jgi:hypothetical protein
LEVHLVLSADAHGHWRLRVAWLYGGYMPSVWLKNPLLSANLVCTLTSLHQMCDAVEVPTYGKTCNDRTVVQVSN